MYNVVYAFNCLICLPKFLNANLNRLLVGFTILWTPQLRMKMCHVHVQPKGELQNSVRIIYLVFSSAVFSQTHTFVYLFYFVDELS